MIPTGGARGGALALLVACPVGLGCSDATAVDTPPAAFYELIAVEGEPVPVEFPADVTVLSGSLILAPDLSCLRVQRVRIAGPGGPIDSEARWGCSWTREDSVIRLTWLLPGLSDWSEARIGEDVLTLHIDTGIVCVRAPCPTRWSEEYELSEGRRTLAIRG